MDRVRIRVTHTDGCVLTVKMPRRDFETLYDAWVAMCLAGTDGLIRLPSAGGKLVAVPVGEIATIEPIEA